MRNLPFAAQLILQEMRHYRLILKLEEMNLPDLDTDAYMIGLCDTVAALLGLPAQRPEAWENTYALYVDEVKRFDISVPVLHREGGTGGLGPAMLRGPAHPGGGNEAGLADQPGFSPGRELKRRPPERRLAPAVFGGIGSDCATAYKKRAGS